MFIIHSSIYPNSNRAEFTWSKRCECDCLSICNLSPKVSCGRLQLTRHPKMSESRTENGWTLLCKIIKLHTILIWHRVQRIKAIKRGTANSSQSHQSVDRQIQRQLLTMADSLQIYFIQTQKKNLMLEQRSQELNIPQLSQAIKGSQKHIHKNWRTFPRVVITLSAS